MTHVNLYNAEGYFDPTVYAALTHIEQEAKRTAYKPLVFICSPYAGNIRRNTERAREYCRFAVSKNCIPIAPHLLFPQFMEESRPTAAPPWHLFRTGLAEQVQGGVGIRAEHFKGMAVEIEKAHERGLPIRYFTEQCVEVTKK